MCSHACLLSLFESFCQDQSAGEEKKNSKVSIGEAKDNAAVVAKDDDALESGEGGGDPAVVEHGIPKNPVQDNKFLVGCKAFLNADLCGLMEHLNGATKEMQQQIQSQIYSACQKLVQLIGAPDQQESISQPNISCNNARKCWVG